MKAATWPPLLPTLRSVTANTRHDGTEFLEIAARIPASAFHPAPKVDSATGLEQYGNPVHHQGGSAPFQRHQGLAPSVAVSVREQQVGAEVDEPMDPVGLLIQDPSI